MPNFVRIVCKIKRIILQNEVILGLKKFYNLGAWSPSVRWIAELPKSILYSTTTTAAAVATTTTTTTSSSTTTTTTVVVAAATTTTTATHRVFKV